MKEKLTKNLGLKILSVFLAFFVWLAVINISNPDVTDDQDVTLEILNEDVLTSKNKTYEIQGKNTVTIHYKVRTLDRSSIHPSDFRAYIDLANMWEVTGAVPVKVEVLNGKGRLVGSVTANPDVIRVRTEEIQNKRFDLKVNVIGKAEDGYTAGVPTVSPGYVYVKGPMSMVGQISYVGVEIKADNATGNLSGTLTPIPYDANGNQLTQLMVSDKVRFSTNEIDYELPVLKVKDLSLSFETSGKVADGYRFTGIESSVKTVAVRGLKSQLAEVTSIVIPYTELNLDGATQDKVVKVNLTGLLPPGVEIADGNEEVIITMKVEALENRSFQLKSEGIAQVGAQDQYLYQYGNDTVNVTVRGLKEDLDQLTSETMGAEVDVSALVPGTHQVPVTFHLSEGYQVIRSDNLEITVGEKEKETTAQSTEESSQAESAAVETGSAAGPQGETQAPAE